MTLASALVNWSALAEALGVAFVAVVTAAVCFGLIVRGSARRAWPAVAVGAIGCLAAAAFGIAAMLHK
ncbi:MAG: hypothetical protein JOY72_05680 [Actinobacteria bacterium]|nr:hypothetical protein [Actinomycetota bacterium]